MRLLSIVSFMLLMLCRTASADSFDIVFLGDNARIEIVKQCKTKCQYGSLKVGAPQRDSTASDIANYVQKAKHAVIVVDATQGPLPITREHILIARQAGVPSLSIMFVNTAGLEGMPDAAELIRLEEREVRELMNRYEMGGNSAMVFYDAPIKAAPRLHANGIGLRASFEKIISIPAKRIYDVKYFSGSKLFTYVYLLTTQEAKSVITIRQNSMVDIWINGQSTKGHIRSKDELMPGGNGELVIEVVKPVSAAKGSRFLIEKEGKIVAAGVVVNVGS